MKAKHIFKKAAITLLALCIVMGTTACGRKKNGGSSGSNAKTDWGVDFGGRTVKIWASYQVDPRLSESAKNNKNYEEVCQAWDDIERDFNCKIEILTQEDFDYFRNGFLNAYSSGEVIADIITGDMTYSYPTWIINDMLYPLDEILDCYDKNGDSPWDKKVSEVFTYNGQCYAVKQKNNTLPKYVMFFNQNLFEKQESLKKYDLFGLVRNEEWTWDKFLEIAKTATIDSNGDGNADIMGVVSHGQPGSFLINGLAVSNGNYFVKNENGKVTFDLDSDSGLAALEFAYKMAWDEKCLGVTGVFNSWTGGEDEFKAGRAAFFAGDRGDMGLKNDMEDKIGMLPFPMGPNSGGKYIGDYPVTDFWGIVNGCSQPESCAKLMTALVSIGNDESVTSAYESQVDLEENLEMIDIMLKSRVYTQYYGYQVLIDEILWSDYGLRDRISPATFLAQKKGIINSALESIWTPMS